MTLADESGKIAMCTLTKKLFDKGRSNVGFGFLGVGLHLELGRDGTFVGGNCCGRHDD